MRRLELAAGALAACLAGAEPAAAQGPPLGLPPIAYPADNPSTPEKAGLGRKLFFDRRLSTNATMSCAMCHVPEQGFTANTLRTPLGVEGRSVRRNAPSVLNVAYVRHLFHDGRTASLEEQVWSPLLADNEMANRSRQEVVERIRTLPDYRGLFEAAFGRQPSPEALGQALAAYQRTLVAGNSRFDRWWFTHDRTALSEEERRGFEIFYFQGGCQQCHRIELDRALFTDNGFHNTGIGHARSAATKQPVRVNLAPGVVAELTPEQIATFGEPQAEDLGRMEVTKNPDDRWKYRTPSLRNVALTAPYMHDGSLAGLDDVVEYYDWGGSGDAEKSGWIVPLNLSAADKRALAAFLGTLTGDNVEELARAARR